MDTDELIVPPSLPLPGRQVRRMVLRHRDGLMQIFGTADGQPPAYIDRGVPEPICLVATRKHFYEYRPLMLPPSSVESRGVPDETRFDPKQR